MATAPPAGPRVEDPVAHHYDELDPFYRALWGEHLHHGLWTTGAETPEEAAMALVEEVGRRGGIGPGTRVCDIGCGYGAPARVLRRHGAEVTGLTLSPAQHRHATTARPPDPGLRLLLRDWLHNGLPPETFDCAVAIESLSHMADPDRAVTEAFRVLRPGGRLVACVWLAGDALRPWQQRHLVAPIVDEGRLAELPTAGQVRDRLGTAGFVDVALEDVTQRVARTWWTCARRVAAAAAHPSSLRYLLDRRNTERRFALSVLRIAAAYRVGAMRYGLVTATRPAGEG